MIDPDKLIALINVALSERDNLIAESKYYKGHENIIIEIKTALDLLKLEVLSNSDNINERVLRAMHDLGIASFKFFENWPLEQAINNITETLYCEIPNYKNLAPLGEDFGKGNPI